MDRMTHELANIRHAEKQARMARTQALGEIRDDRTGNGIRRMLRMGRR